MLHHVQKWCGNVKSVKTQVANKSRRNIEVLQTTKQQSIEMPFSRCWCLIIRTRYIKSWNFFCKCTKYKLKLMYRLDHFLHPVANTTRIIICFYISFIRGTGVYPHLYLKNDCILGGHCNPPPPWSHLFEVMIGLSTGDVTSDLEDGNLLPGTLKRTAIFCTWKMDGKGIRPRFGLFGFISAYFCSWCELLVSGKGISRKKWSSFVQMFRFHVFGVFMEVIYEMMEGRNFYHQAEAKRLPDHPNTDSGRHQPAALTSRTKKHPWSFNMLHLENPPLEQKIPNLENHHFQVNHVFHVCGSRLRPIFVPCILKFSLNRWSWGWYVYGTSNAVFSSVLLVVEGFV